MLKLILFFLISAVPFPLKAAIKAGLTLKSVDGHLLASVNLTNTGDKVAFIDARIFNQESYQEMPFDISSVDGKRLFFSRADRPRRYVGKKFAPLPPEGGKVVDFLLPQIEGIAAGEKILLRYAFLVEFYHDVDEQQLQFVESNQACIEFK